MYMGSFNSVITAQMERVRGAQMHYRLPRGEGQNTTISWWWVVVYSENVHSTSVFIGVCRYVHWIRLIRLKRSGQDERSAEDKVTSECAYT